MKKPLAYLFFLSFLCGVIQARHIVGGEMIYDKLGGNNYRVTLKLYRDCGDPNNPNFDGIDPTPALITVIETLGSVVDTLINIGVPVVSNVPSSINNPCIQPPGGVCVEEGIYTCTINLPPKTGGYYIVYQTCCRNASIINLLNASTQGATYFAKIPGPEEAAANSSPRFTKFPPKYICNNVTFNFDHSATDPDGDQLVYSLYAPFLGLNPGCPIGAPGCPTAASAPPYQTVNYTGNYSGSYPIASSPAFSINPGTGLLTGRPSLVGQFVVGVLVQEYRGGVLIGEHHRDFQFNVRPCIVNVLSLFKDQEVKCQGTTITFTNQSSSNVGALTYHWDFGDGNTLADTSQAQNPSYTYQDTGRFTVTLIANPGKPCSDTCIKTIYVYPPLRVSFSPPGKQCLKGNNFNFNNTGSYINGATYNWNFSAAANPSTSVQKNPSGVVYNQAGLFFVKLVGKQLTCRDSMIDSVRIIGRPVAKINNLPATLCTPARVAFSNGSASELPMQYSWNFSNGNASSEFEPVQTFTNAGVYSATLVVRTSSVCLDTSIASISNITVNPSPVAGFNCSPGVTTIFDPEITFTSTASPEVTNWYYYLGNGDILYDKNFAYAYTAPGIYTVSQIVVNGFNCSDTAVKEIHILPEFRFWIPNTFTPNNDGKNDIFLPVAIGVLKYEFYIYNYWGQKVFSTNDPLKGWDGTFEGKKCQQDVYVWKIRFINEVSRSPEDHFGKVLLLRADE